MKKQIVFIEYVPTIPCFKIARTLKLSQKYETILFSFSEINRDMFSKAYDKIIILNIKHKINLKNILDVLKKVFSKNGITFFRELKNINPDLFQITGPDLFTMFSMFITKNKPKVYYAYDIWQFFEKKWSFKNPGIKEFVQKSIEKICFKKSDGILHKGSDRELNFLRYKVNRPDLALIPGCLEEWMYLPKKKKNKEIHLVYAGGPLSSDNRLPFIEAVKIITSQKMHFHTYGPCVTKEDTSIYIDEDKNNPYFHFHDSEKVENLNKIISEYDYGIIPDFYDVSAINPLWRETSMPNKIFNHIEAGIPSIVPKESGFVFEITKKNKIGFGILKEDLKNLKKMIKGQDYKKLQSNLIKTQNKMKMSKIIKDLEKFYDKIINLKKH